MLFRKIESIIEDHLASGNDRVLLIDGARQIGKSYIIRYVGKRLFPNYIEINMESDKLSDRIFAEAKTLKDFYFALSIIGGDRMKERHNTLVFIDEIQAYPHLLTMLKFLREDGRFTYIASGSLLGVTLRHTQSIPIGSIRVEHMYPLDFEEFLIANDVGREAISMMRESFRSHSALPDALHRKMLDFFKKYLLVGGLPDAVNAFVEYTNIVEVRNRQREVFEMYAADAAKYEEESNRKLKIQRIYQLVPSNMEKTKKRLVAKSVEGKEGKRMTDYEDEFDYLISSGITLEVKAVSQPTYPLIENSGKNLLKLYINDVGILSGLFFRNNIQAVMANMNSINLGSVYETVVAQELRAHGFNLYYYDNKKNGEVDFLIDDHEHSTVLPLEIKSGKDYTRHSALDNFLKVKDYHVRQAYVLSNEPKVFTKNNITYIPIYYIMFFCNE